jgi:RNase P/RNase MRP subunit p29
VSDEKGVLYLWKLKDDYELSKIRQDLYRYFIPNTVFVIANHNGVDELQQVVDGKTVKYSDTPQQITDQMFNYIFGEYQKLKYLNDVVCNGVDNSIKSKMDAYKSNITDISNILSGTDMEKELSSKYSDDVIKNVQKRLNELGKPVYVSGSYDWYTFEQIAELQKQNNIGVTGEIDDNTMKLLNLEGNTEQKKQVTDSKAEMQNRWDYFIKNASEGDILLFNTNERSQWGYNFHSAIIYKIYPETKTIRVLHARSEELGVGADMKMDYISFESLFTEDYWSRVLRISLYKVPNIQAETLKAVVNDAYEKYSGYSFGYGNWNGLKEILCAELIRDAYKKKGIKIDDNNDLMNQIKQVVKGDIAKALFVPDDIMMSNNVKMVSVWERVK